MRARHKKFYHRILHKILHLPDILNVFISLELVAVNGFEVGARRCTSEHHRVKEKPASFKEQKRKLEEVYRVVKVINFQISQRCEEILI